MSMGEQKHAAMLAEAGWTVVACPAQTTHG